MIKATTAIVGVCCAVSIGPAAEASTLGETGYASVPCDGPATYVQSASTAPGYEVPQGGGVITSWSTRAGIDGAHVRLAILRRTPVEDRFTTLAASAPVVLEQGALNSFPTRLKVEAGDLLGYLIDSGAHTCVLTDAGTFEDGGFREVGSVFEVGETGTYTDRSQPNRRLNLAAVLEADQDGDGIGDDPPSSRILVGPKARGNKSRVRFTFESDDPGATFECKLDSTRFRKCSSPRRYSVARGKHRFLVRAIDTDGHLDPTPAKYRFRIGR